MGTRREGSPPPNDSPPGPRRHSSPLRLPNRIAMKKLKAVGLNFDHMHMGDLLRMCAEHPGVEIAGICDERPARMQSVIAKRRIPAERVFTDPDRCLDATRPDFAILCPATARHADYV